MGDAVILFDQVWKKFQRGERHDSLRDLIPTMARKALGRSTRTELEAQEFWALKNVSFDVQPGEALGIIGPNGAGKSTALKLLTRIMRPTRGACAVRGRVGALIEVAAGFHPDLTGRENVFLQGAIMGMRRPEIAARFDEIVDFAGVSEFIDTPVKRYSSGMNARLGFSIAAHLDPEALVIDEVLSVGDMVFQAKCVDRMAAFKRDGVAIAFVSHNLQAVSMLCDKCLFLTHDVRSYGATSTVLHEYLRAAGSAQQCSPGSPVRIVRAGLRAPADASKSIAPGTRLTLDVDLEVSAPVADSIVVFKVYRSTDGLLVYDGNFNLADIGAPVLSPGRAAVTFDFTANLTRGQYHVETHLTHCPTGTHFVILNPAASFHIDETQTQAGVADLAVGASARSAVLAAS